MWIFSLKYINPQRTDIIANILLFDAFVELLLFYVSPNNQIGILKRESLPYWYIKKLWRHLSPLRSPEMDPWIKCLFLHFIFLFSSFSSLFSVQLLSPPILRLFSLSSSSHPPSRLDPSFSLSSSITLFLLLRPLFQEGSNVKNVFIK